MAGIEGVWEFAVLSPMGEQKSDLTLTSSGDTSFSGGGTGPSGNVEILDGEVNGDTVTFKMKTSKPFPMTLKGETTLSGDVMEGKLDTGAFGKLNLKATKKS
ncbi:hypothetical protein [Sphingomonas bacterium]|uniref:hypothetical protein n=1 Tax=Sphingomonas bacterium TaxID=1895847 RepID=UPI0015762C13|nr:hypothetical protein [Sphingomonas bacterium]